MLRVSSFLYAAVVFTAVFYINGAAVIKCPPAPDKIPGGYKSSWSSSSGGAESATYTCPSGGGGKISCANGVWSAPPPTCKGFENAPCQEQLPYTGSSLSGPRKGNQCNKGGNDAPSRCLGDATNLKELMATSINQTVDRHNCWRRNVNPKAKNMAMLKWDDDLAATAERWAAQCNFDHDPSKNRATPNKNWSGVGQNLYISTAPVDVAMIMMYAIDSWAEERVDFQYDKGSINGNVVGHYTQLVWDNTTHIGCGVSRCSSPVLNSDLNGYNKDQIIVACNYGPAGNYNLKKPYVSA